MINKLYRIQLITVASGWLELKVAEKQTLFFFFSNSLLISFVSYVISFANLSLVKSFNLVCRKSLVWFGKLIFFPEIYILNICWKAFQVSRHNLLCVCFEFLWNFILLLCCYWKKRNISTNLKLELNIFFNEFSGSKLF